MRTTMRAASALALAAATLLLQASEAPAAAGCGGDEKAKKAMQAKMTEAAKMASQGETRRAFEGYRDAKSMGACPIMVKECEAKAQELFDHAKETLDKAKELATNKEAEQEEVLTTLCDLFQLQLGWRGHAVGGEAAKRSKKLLSKKRKQLKGAIKDADKQVETLAKEGAAHLRRNDIRSALNSYEQIFASYAYSRKAKKYIGGYIQLKQKVRELDEQERQREK